MNKLDLKVYIVGCMALSLIGAYFIDMSASALVSGGALVNGLFMSIPPGLLYHVGLWMVIVCSIFSTLLSVRYIKEG